MILICNLQYVEAIMIYLEAFLNLTKNPQIVAPEFTKIPTKWGSVLLAIE